MTVSTIQTWFEAAQKVPISQRHEFLHLNCDDPVVRERVIRMLSIGQGFLDQPLSNIINSLKPVGNLNDPAELIGENLGGFHLLELLAQGGSAAVYRGEKTRHGVTQTVAVKVLRRLLTDLPDNDFQQRSFKSELLALTQLSHPNIARLIDGGITEEGLAFIVLEYVNGVRITEHARRARLSLADRLNLLISVCRTVEAAHRSLIVHRDIKPSNVLVTHDGHVKLVDFGISKILTATDDAIDRAQRAFTPAFAAPEQISGAQITTATDVYALGALLRVLTNDPAGNTDTPNTDEPELIGHSFRFDALRNEKDDLAHIIKKAMAQKADQRYSSAGAMADDIRRFLEIRPVTARAHSRRYKLIKFCKRNRLLVSMSAVLISLILATTGIALHQADTANRQSVRALREAAFSQATRDFMIEIFRMAEPSGARAALPTVAEVTDAAIVRIDNDLHLDQRVRLHLKVQLGAVLLGQSRTQRSIELLRQAYDEGIAKFGMNDPMVMDAGIQLVDALINAGRYEHAHDLVYSLAPNIAKQDSDRKVNYSVVASTLAANRGDREEALRQIDAAANECRSYCSKPVRLNMLSSYGSVSGLLGRNIASAQAWEKAVDLARSMHGSTHSSMALALNGLGGAYGRLGRWQEAKRIAIEVLAIDDRILLPELHWQRSLHLNKLGYVHFALGEYEQALTAFHDAADITLAVNGEEDETLGTDIQNIGMVYLKLGDFDESIRYLKRALQHRIRFAGSSDRITASHRARLAFAYALKGDHINAKRLFDRAVGELRKAGENSLQLLSDALRNRSRSSLWVGDTARALADIDEAIEISGSIESDIAKTHIATAQVTRGMILLALDREDEAVDQLKASADRLAQENLERPRLAEANYALALIAARQDECLEAKRYFKSGRSILEQEPYVYHYLERTEDEVKEALKINCDLSDEAQLPLDS